MSREARTIGVFIFIALFVFGIGFLYRWDAATAISTTILGAIAIFGEEIRRWTFKSRVEIIEFPAAVADQANGLTKPVVHHHYLEIVNHGRTIDDARVEILAVTFSPRTSAPSNKDRQSHTMRLPGVVLRLGGHIGGSASSNTLRFRDVLKIGQISSNESFPKLVVDLEPRHNPIGEQNGDPHYRGRFHIQVTGRNFSSEVWDVDYVRDGQVSSGWRLEVVGKQAEKRFWAALRNYTREFNENKRGENLL